MIGNHESERFDGADPARDAGAHLVTDFSRGPLSG